MLSHRMPNGEEKPVGFASRTLSKVENNYSHLDKEALGIIYGVKRFHQYLHGRAVYNWWTGLDWTGLDFSYLRAIVTHALNTHWACAQDVHVEKLV